MRAFPNDDAWRALYGAAEAIAPTAAIGITRRADGTSLSVVYKYAHGVTGYLPALNEAPRAFDPETAGIQSIDREALLHHPTRPVEWHLTATGVSSVISLPLHSLQPATRFWIGLRDAVATVDHAKFEALAALAADLLSAPASADEDAARLRRLEMTASLLPSLVQVLDVREIFEGLSASSKDALSHDMLTLGLFSDDYTKVSMHARTGTGPDVGGVFDQPYPPDVLRTWDFDIVTDRLAHPIERDRIPTKLGCRSSLRHVIRVNGRAIGGLGFMAFEPHSYTMADVEIGRRLADYITIALSHRHLAEEGRRAEALRERAANLEMLDGLLTALTGVLDIREVFDRVSEIAETVLSHDALAIAEILEDGRSVRVHASRGLGPVGTPFDVATPDRTLVTAAGDFKLVDDLIDRPEFAQSHGRAAGMRSVLIVPILVEGRQFGGLVFYSKTPGRYSHDDVLVSRRIADHVALALSHQRLAETARANEALRARTANLELLDELLAPQIDADDLYQTCDRISSAVKRVLPHDAVFVPIITPDGKHAHVYTSRELPRVTELAVVPQAFLENPDWEQEIVNDTSLRTEPNHVKAARAGYQSALRVPIRLEGRFAGTLVFLSKVRAAFKEADVLVGRRIADRIAMSLARNRELEAARRADEASARAAKLEARVRSLTDELDARTGVRRVVGESPEWRRVLKEATQVASNDTTVLLLGESGTGKEVIARFVHRASARKTGSFIALNCAALPEQLLEAELFGYERGAFTGAMQSKPGQLEQAAGGTLFLDEVGEMSLPAQAKFLRVLQEREFLRLGGTRVLRSDARILAATNRDLPRSIEQGHFRDDLYYRLNVFPIQLPPLRQRRDDIVALAEVFLTEIGRGLGRPPAVISRPGRELLVNYDWPGNVRELRNILERASILCEGGLITEEHLASGLTNVPPRTPASIAPARGEAPVRASSSNDLKTIERDMIEQALNAARFNKSKAAKALGLTRQQLYLRMKRYGLE